MGENGDRNQIYIGGRARPLRAEGMGDRARLLRTERVGDRARPLRAERVKVNLPCKDKVGVSP